MRQVFLALVGVFLTFLSVLTFVVNIMMHRDEPIQEKDISKLCEKYAQDCPRYPQKCAQDIPKIRPRNVQYMPNICQKHAIDMTNI